MGLFTFLFGEYPKPGDSGNWDPEEHNKGFFAEMFEVIFDEQEEWYDTWEENLRSESANKEEYDPCWDDYYDDRDDYDDYDDGRDSW